MAPTFVQKQAGDPLYLLEVSFPSQMEGYTVAFWPVVPTGDQTLTLQRTWQYGGLYLFLGVTPKDQPQFIGVLRRFLSNPAYSGVVFLWIANPADSPEQWRTSWIALSGGVTNMWSRFAFRSISLLLGPQCAVGLNATEDGLTVNIPTGAAYLTVGSDSNVVPGVVSPLTLAFTESDAGCLCFEVHLDNSGTKHAPDFDRLDVGCRFFASDSDQSVGDSRLVSWRYPIFDSAAPAATDLRLAATLDPLNPLLSERTFFSFLPGSLRSGPALPSFYVTNMGYRLALTPTLPDADNLHYLPRLVLAVRAFTNPPQPGDPVYLTPAGLFTISILAPETGWALANASLAARVLCGCAGLEYLGLAQGEGNRLFFFPDQAAYAPTYSAREAHQEALTSLVTTSWAFLTGPQESGIDYFAQPDQAPLFWAEKNERFLSFFEISAVTLPGRISTGGPTSTMFPLVAFLGIEEPDYLPYQQFEAQILSPLRRQIVSRLAVGAPERTLGGSVAAPQTAGTPQGLLAEFDPAMTITLATARRIAQQLRFSNIQGPLFQAFQTNQLFLAISDKAALQQYATLVGSLLSIVTDGLDTWQFDIFDGWNEHQTIVILKFHRQSLGNLVDDSATWSSPAIFNAAVAVTQKRIRTIIEDARKRVDNEPEFAYFVDTVVADPNWNGILFLNCKVPLDGLPEQIAGIAVGLDARQFYAHHLGVTETPLRVVGNTVLPAADSSLFGLIAYTDLADPTPTDNPYQFKVLSLKVLFFNSTVTSFACQIAFLASQFFGEPVTSPDSGHGENVIVLNGTYQQQGATNTYLFLSTQRLRFTAQSYVLDNLEIVRAQFITVISPGEVQPGQQAESRLLLWGVLRFHELPGFDLFSFGDSERTWGGIPYSGLAVNIRYDLAEPPTKTLAFDASQMAFDVSGSKARPGSLFARFPLALSGLVEASGEKTTPASLGYLGVDAPIGQSSLTVPWFGLTFTLNLGSAGALATAGTFSATLLAAWSPNPESANVAIGLKLPGADGAQSTFSLESVLKLKVRRIAFAVIDDTYVLNLNNIALSALGLTLPPGGQTNLLLFGEPGGQENAALGWYAGYAKDEQEEKGDRIK